MYCIRCFRMPDVELNIYIWFVACCLINVDVAETRRKQSRVSFQDSHYRSQTMSPSVFASQSKRHTLVAVFCLVLAIIPVDAVIYYGTMLRNNSNVGFDSLHRCSSRTVRNYRRRCRRGSSRTTWISILRPQAFRSRRETSEMRNNVGRTYTCIPYTRRRSEFAVCLVEH